MLLLLLLSGSVMKQGPDVFGSEYAQNFVSCLHSVMKRKGKQDEEATRSQVCLNLVLDTLLSNRSFQWTRTEIGYRDLHLHFGFSSPT